MEEMAGAVMAARRGGGDGGSSGIGWREPVVEVVVQLYLRRRSARVLGRWKEGVGSGHKRGRRVEGEGPWQSPTTTNVFRLDWKSSHGEGGDPLFVYLGSEALGVPRPVGKRAILVLGVEGADRGEVDPVVFGKHWDVVAEDRAGDRAADGEHVDPDRGAALHAHVWLHRQEWVERGGGRRRRSLGVRGGSERRSMEDFKSGSESVEGLVVRWEGSDGEGASKVEEDEGGVEHDLVV